MRRQHVPIRLSDHFDYKRLLLFVLPSIGMMIFTSIYGVVDGLFVSHFAGKSAFTAINLIMPFPMLLGAFGFMIGTGGSAVVAITLGEQKKEKANEYFSFFIAVTIVGGLILSALGIVFLEPIAVFFGAEGETLTHCLSYGRILFLFLTAFMLQNTFQSFLVTAEKPMFGLIVTVAAGVVNMVLDLLFVGIFQWGVVGAALATGISQTVGGVIPLIFFRKKNNSLLRLVRPHFFGRVLGNACVNGSSELMTNISLSLVNMLFNYQLMDAIGEDGVAAYGVIMYVSFIFIAVFIGYSFGSAPIVGYHYGAENRRELRNVFRKSLTVVCLCGIVMVLGGVLASGLLSNLFVGYDPALAAITRRGFMLYSLAYAFIGVNIYASSFFTALGNGLVSAIISFLRTLLFQVATLLILPIFFDVDGIWCSVVVAELMALAFSLFFFITQRKKYGYA